MTQLLLLLLVGFATIAFSSARIQKRIINGDVAGYTQFPYMVSMRVTTTSSHTCGGALITHEHVVTAAHCVANDEPTPVLPTERFIVSGHLNNGGGGRVTRISEVRIHPEYNPATSWRNDIAILKLATPIPFTATEQPIPIPTADVGVQPCVISGWGRIHFPSTALPSQLQTAVQNTMTRETCIQTWNSSSIFDSSLCAGAQMGVGVCSGDSGSPLVCNGELAGIASWVNPCANGLPDVYARAFYYRVWLRENSADVSPMGEIYAAKSLEARKSW